MALPFRMSAQQLLRLRRRGGIAATSKKVGRLLKGQAFPHIKRQSRKGAMRISEAFGKEEWAQPKNRS
jgi:hypothetical protein